MKTTLHNIEKSLLGSRICRGGVTSCKNEEVSLLVNDGKEERLKILDIRNKPQIFFNKQTKSISINRRITKITKTNKKPKENTKTASNVQQDKIAKIVS